MKKKHYLIKNFVVYSFVACFVIGILLIIFINSHVKKDKIYSDQQVIHLTLHYIVEPELSGEDLKDAISQSKIKLLDNKLQQLINEDTISSVRIWSNKNKLIYSSNKDFLEINIADSDLKKALESNLTYIITKDNSNKTSLNDNEIIKFYLPITYNNEIVATYEVVKSYSDIKYHIKELTIIISVSIFLGLALLYTLLIKVIYNSSKTLISQNKALTKNKLDLEASYETLNNAYKSTIITLDRLQ
ncbi:hypothetical protein [Clostridium tyrobutyricum]|uniref:hypothetical protein n=1 Tax=Clostridium tyrobutyricum TaxID=1519 RepID=UPI002B20B0C4|nr:hypothetical protein [Clostridium tyrobutyricum]MEA5009040.1 hypothetical protein [Clostridium tyrobutyricum]